MDANMSAAVTGALAGGCISFAMGAVFRFIDQERDIHVLKVGIKAELLIYKNELAVFKVQLQNNINPNEKVFVNKGVDLNFLDANLSKIGALKSNTVKEIVRLRAQHGLLNEVIGWVNGNAPHGINFVVASEGKVLGSLSEQASRMLTLCDTILSDLK